MTKRQLRKMNKAERLVRKARTLLAQCIDGDKSGDFFGDVHAFAITAKGMEADIAEFNRAYKEGEI